MGSAGGDPAALPAGIKRWTAGSQDGECVTSFYWHDYETWGVDPSRDRAAQFAGLRTDAELNEVGEPLVMYCRPPDDALPEPEACLVTGITPQQAAAQGLPEAEFVAALHAELAHPGTCGVGYNSIRFDDEVTRYSLYRNFYDPYAREWQNGNSRWDLIDVARACYALRPDGIHWPRRDDGLPSFRLEEISRANGLEHEQAHDALSDVRATLALARLIRRRQPRLFDYLLTLRDKRRAAVLLDVRRRKPVLHVSGMFPAERGCTALVMPLAAHPHNRNGVICADLSADPEPLLSLEVEVLRERLFTPKAELGEGVARVPLKVIHINRCPVIATPRLLEAEDARRLHLDLDACERHYRRLLEVADLGERVARIYAQPSSGREAEVSGGVDVDAALYQGFFDDADRRLLEAVRQSGPEALRRDFGFRDSRLPELLFRYRARNWPQSLDSDERESWRALCAEAIQSRWGPGAVDYERRLATLEPEAEAGRAGVLAQLREHARERCKALGLTPTPAT